MLKNVLFISMAFALAGANPEKLFVTRTLPHTGYSEGLDFHQGYLWHALPKEIVKIDPKDGLVLERFKPATDYSESITWFQGKLFNLSFSDNSIHAGSLQKKGLTFRRAGNVPEVHGWGITHDGTHLIVTGDYSPKLYYLHPKTMSVKKTLTTPISDLEDLAWDGTHLWSSSLTKHRGQIFRISPKDGQIVGFYTLPDPESCPVIDGIAFDGTHLWITGKQCPSIFSVKLPPKH